MSSGGARENAGRKPGSASKRSAEVVADALAQGKTPLEYLLDVMRDDNADAKRRDWAAEKAAAFIHPRPTPMERKIEIELPDTSTIEGIGKALDTVIKAVSKGEISPSEGQSVIGVVEARRKAIETNDLAVRIDALERRADASR